VIPILAVLSFLGWFFFFAFLTGFQCPRCNELYFVIGFGPTPHAYPLLEVGLPRDLVPQGRSGRTRQST
jgi:hypothetical protein